MTDDDLRDDFGEEITEALRIRSHAPAPGDAGLVAANSAPRLRTRRRVLATALAAAIIVSGVAVVALRDRGTRGLRVVTGPSSVNTTTTTVPSSFKPLTTGIEDWTWVSDNHGWAIVRERCGQTVCVALRETVDGGRTWTPLPSPHALDPNAQFEPGINCATQPCVTNVRFATAKIGWLFGPALFQTGDGGHTWTRVRGKAVTELEAANGFAMRATGLDGNCSGFGCRSAVDRSRVGSATWRRLPTSAASSFPTLILQGNETYAVYSFNPAVAGSTYIRHSSDEGASWHVIPDPCPGPAGRYRTAQASAAPDGVFAVLCISMSRSTVSIRISTDSGKTFGARRPVPEPMQTLGPIAAASADTIAIAFSDQHHYGVMVTHDGGITWRTTLARTSASSFSPSLGWEDAHTARASFDTNVIWTTRDGGRSWAENRVTP